MKSIFKKLRFHYIILVLILFIGSMLRIYNLGYDSLWLDEAVSLDVSKKSIQELVVSDINHPPLYYLLLHFWTGLGVSEFFLRFPSVIFAVLSIFICYKMAYKFYGCVEGLISAFLLSISYIHIYYSKEARMYSMLVFLTLLSIYFFYLALETNRKKFWAVFVLASILGLYTHYMMLPILVAETIYFFYIYFYKKIKKVIKPFIYSYLIIFMAFLPLIVMFFSAFSSKVSGENLFGVQANYEFFHEVVRWFGADFQFGGKETYFSLVYILLFSLGIYLSQENEGEVLMLLLWFFIPIIFSFIMASSMFYMPRYVLNILPAYLILISRGIKVTPNLVLKVKDKKIFKIIMTILLIAGIGIISFQPLNNITTQKIKVDWRGCAAYLETNTLDGDVIVVLPGYNDLPLRYYYNNVTDNTTLLKPNNLTEIQFQSQTNKRIWYVYTSDILWMDTNYKIQKWISENSELKKDFKGVFIFFKL